MTKEINAGPKAREALKKFHSVFNGPPHCQPEWKGDFEHLVEWATDFVIQEKKSAEKSRVTGDGPEENTGDGQQNKELQQEQKLSEQTRPQAKPVCDQDPDHQANSETTESSRLSDFFNRTPDWVVTYFLNAQEYPRLEIIVRSMREVKVARYQDQIDELAEFVDSVLDHEDEDMLHDEELHVVEQKLSEVKTFLEDLRMDKARSAAVHQSQQTVVCKGCISQFITNPERLREMGIEEGSEEEAEFAELAEWLWKQVWEEEVGNSGYTSLDDVASDLNSFVSSFSEYLFLQDAHHMLSIERHRFVTASQNGQAAVPRKSNTADQNANEAKRNAGGHLPTLRRWIDSLGRRLRRS